MFYRICQINEIPKCKTHILPVDRLHCFSLCCKKNVYFSKIKECERIKCTHIFVLHFEKQTAKLTKLFQQSFVLFIDLHQ